METIGWRPVVHSCKPGGCYPATSNQAGARHIRWYLTVTAAAAIQIVPRACICCCSLQSAMPQAAVPHHWATYRPH